MRKTAQPIRSTEVAPLRWILGGLISITLYFQINLSDPFNSPKQWILLVVSAWLIGYIVSFKIIIFSNYKIKSTFKILLLFIFFALTATLMTDFKYTAIFGDTQRRNGFISYVSLAIVLLSASIFVRQFNIKRLYFATLFIASI